MAEGQGKTKRASSLVGSVASVDSKGKARSYPLWPEFTENDINSEKWESTSKGKEKGKSPNLQFFDDPEGKLDLPFTIRVDHWKRPQDFIASKIPVVVDNESYIDILNPNEHLFHSQLIRTIISQIILLWNMTRTKPGTNSLQIRPEIFDGPWKPWEHIYSQCKAGKGHMPLYNQYGKYIVRLYWMGCWRKIVVDDLMPCDVDGKLLLPVSTIDYELWPLLLSKALIKIAVLDCNFHVDSSEMGDYFVLQCLTGWIPEVIPLQVSHYKHTWELVKKIVPEWKLPEDKTIENEPDVVVPPTSSAKPRELSGTKQDVVGSASQKPEKGSGKAGKEGNKKKDEKEKSKSRPHSDRPISARSTADKSVTDETIATRPEDVQVVVFGTFAQAQDSYTPLTMLRNMANSSEHLRKVGLSHLHSHPVLITKTRSCSLVPPTPVPEIPRWKLIRPMKKKTTPFDEPQAEPEPPKPDQWFEIESPFIGYRISTLPTDAPAFVPNSTAPSVVLDEIDEEREGIVEKVEKTKSKQGSRNGGKLNENADGRHSSLRESPRRTPTPVVNKDSNESDSTTFSKHEEEGEEEGEDPHDLDGGYLHKTTEHHEVVKQTWMEFDEFCKSFTNIVIFHKPYTYSHSESATEMKQSALNAGQSTGGSKKGSAQMNQASSNTNVVKQNLHSPITPKSYEGYPPEERTPSFLFVDNLNQTELIVGFSVLSRWPGAEEKRTSDKESVAGASEVVSTRHENAQGIPSGLLVAEPYSWKSLVTGQPVLRIRTTGTRASCLTLPPGRHVLRFLFNSPMGYHIHICSTTKFTYGDEDSVMAPLQEESCRFVETANRILSNVEQCMDVLGNEAEWKTATFDLHKSHMPYHTDNKHLLVKHYDAWNKAFYNTMRTVMGDGKLAAFNFALHSFLLDASFSSSMVAGSKEVPENWFERSATEDEMKAVKVLQRHWRGTFTRKIMRAHKLDSREHATALDVLKTVRVALQHNFQANASTLLRSMLKEYPDLITKFSFYKDEWNRICYTDYQGTFAEQPPRTWFVVFREVFYVEEDMLCVPKIYIPIPTCSLRVIDNDTGLEVKRVFQKVAPYVYKKNQRGYTFVAEARTLENPIPSGKWRMRLIGSMNALPTPANSLIPTQLSVKDIRDYYVPNKDHILLRYAVKCQTNFVGTLQLETSKPDAHIKFQILDNEEEIVSTKGKGHCVLPAFYFYTNNKERSSSRLSNQDSKQALVPQPSKQAITTTTKRQSGSAKKDGKTSPKEPRRDSGGSASLPSNEELTTDGPQGPTHNYILQAIVERKSWPLTRGQWAFVQKLKDIEKEELKAFTVNKERASSPGGQKQAGSKTAAAAAAAGGGEKRRATKGGEKTGKEKKQVDKESGSRPSSQNIYDESKAYWTLRCVTDLEVNEEVDIKKDTQRQEEIKAMKQAWETADPGRAIKAMQSRLAFLNNNNIKVDSTEKENEDEDAKAAELPTITPELLDDKELLNSPDPVPSANDFLKPLDLTPYIRLLPTTQIPRYVSPQDLAVIEEEDLKTKVSEHNATRSKSLAYREQNRIDRIILKEHQLEICQEMQYMLDKARSDLLKPREEYRQKLLEEKRLKDEAAEAAANALAVASAPPTPDVKARKSGKKKK